MFENLNPKWTLNTIFFTWGILNFRHYVVVLCDIRNNKRLTIRGSYINALYITRIINKRKRIKKENEFILENVWIDKQTMKCDDEWRNGECRWILCFVFIRGIFDGIVFGKNFSSKLSNHLWRSDTLMFCHMYMQPFMTLQYLFVC